MRIGELIAARRKEKGWSLRKLEALTGISNAVISQIETGHVKDPGFSTAVKLADALRIAPERAFGAGRDPITARDVLKIATKRITVVGKVTGHIHEGDQVAGMPGAICHACGLGYKCWNADCPNDTPAPSPMMGPTAAV
jgi:transcriptional regulator with XRE-family HTH domain